MMFPTARAARGLPASFATAPYVVTRPTGTRRTTESTRRANAVSTPNADLHPYAAAAEVVLAEMLRHAAAAERIGDRRPRRFAADRDQARELIFETADDVEPAEALVGVLARVGELRCLLIAIGTVAGAAVWH